MIYVNKVVSIDAVNPTIGEISGLSKEMVSDEAETLKRCALVSASVYKGVIDGELACIWGLVPPSLISTQAYLWLYTSKVADEHTFLLVRYSQMMVKEMLKEYSCLTGHCVVGQDRSIRWLKWLGARFGEPDGRLIPFWIGGGNG